MIDCTKAHLHVLFLGRQTLLYMCLNYTEVQEQHRHGGIINSTETLLPTYWVLCQTPGFAMRKAHLPLSEAEALPFLWGSTRWGTVGAWVCLLLKLQPEDKRLKEGN